MKKVLIGLSIAALITALSVSMLFAAAGATGPRVMASNDLGMHCACPNFDFVTVLPPFNTLRAQIFVKGSGDPQVSTAYRVTYSVTENTDAILKADPYFQNWILNAPKLFPASKGYLPPVRSDGRVQSPLTGATLSGDMTAKAGGFYEVAGVPIYPVVTKGGGNIMTDPLGGPNRNPYLTWNVNVVDANGKVLASTTNTAPIAFGGCCACHIKLAQTELGKQSVTPLESFQVMGAHHANNSSHINIATIDPDGDGVPGPIRCSQCHLDPAMGESVAPGYAGYSKSRYTFSDVLHRFHAQDSLVLSSYDPDIAKNCYDCHPGNGVNCYRDTHTQKSINGHAIWCTDCHGDLNQRIAQGQLLNPWNIATLPKCSTCHGSHGESSTYSFTSLFGAFLGSKQRMGLCSTCHGSPHGLNPSTLAKDNAQNIALQNDSRAIGKCDVCHGNEGSTWRNVHNYN